MKSVTVTREEIMNHRLRPGLALLDLLLQKGIDIDKKYETNFGPNKDSVIIEQEDE